MSLPVPDSRAQTDDPKAPRKWDARLDLSFVRGRDKTLVYPRHEGPLLVQRPFYPEADGTCHSYILHPPGGVVGGDSLQLNVTVGQGARSVLTAPGATKFYRSPHGASRQSVVIDVEDDGACEYLPMETIVFDGANAHVDTEVRLAGTATFVGWDIVSLGRPAAGERFASGRFTQRYRISRDGRPIWFERAAFVGGSDMLDAAHGLAGQPIVGTMVYAGALPEDAVQIIRRHLEPAVTGLASVTQLQDVVICRYAGPKVSSARKFYLAMWQHLRKLGQTKFACNPRIWMT